MLVKLHFCFFQTLKINTRTPFDIKTGSQLSRGSRLTFRRHWKGKESYPADIQICKSWYLQTLSNSLSEVDEYLINMRLIVSLFSYSKHSLSSVFPPQRIWTETSWACSLTLKTTANCFFLYSLLFWKRHCLKMNSPRLIDRLTFGTPGNESEDQVSSFLLFSSPRGQMEEGRKEGKKEGNTENISEGRDTVFRKREAYTETGRDWKEGNQGVTSMFLHHLVFLDLFPCFPSSSHLAEI